MKRLILITIYTSLFVVSLFAQNEGITIGDSNETLDGTIRYNNATGFEGLHLGNWLPFAGTNTSTSPWLTNGTSLYYNAGSVGIGTNTPAYKLDINGNVGTGAIFTSIGRLELNANGTGDRSSYLDFHATDNEPDHSARIARLLGEDGGLVITNKGAGAIKFYSDIALTTMTILSDGNVGVGTQNPEVKLQVTGLENNGTVASLKVTSGAQNMLIDGNEIDTDDAIGLYLNNNNNNSVLLANGGGKVGIGTNSPAYTLDVNGDIGTGAIFTTEGRVEIGKDGSGDRNSYIDFHASDAETD